MGFIGPPASASSILLCFLLLLCVSRGDDTVVSSGEPRLLPRHSTRSAPLPVQDAGLSVLRSEHGLSELFSRFAPMSDRVDNEECRNHSIMYLEQLDNFTLWAVEMFDSSAKFPDGLIAGNTYQMGAFDECIAVKAHLSAQKDRENLFTGQYCLADIQLLPPESGRDHHPYEYIKDPNGSAWAGIKYTGDLRVRRRDVFQWAFCIPSTCRPIDLQNALEDALVWVQKEYGISMRVQVKDRMCQTAGKPSMSAGAIVVTVVMSSFLIAVIAGTTFDLCFRGKNKELSSIAGKVAESFSARANLRNLLKTEISRGELKAIHGVRFYSMMLIILGHRCMFSFGGPLHNPQFVEYIYTDAINMFLLNGPIIVDTFFLISGFLTCYLLILELDKRKKYNIFLLYLYRYIRLTPVYIVIVAFYATLLERVNEGPLWKAKVGLESERCEMNWWTNLLYVNNYVNRNNLCMFQSWYVTCDMHFFLVAPLLVYPLWRWPRYGKAALFLITLLSIAIPFAVTYIGRLDAVLLLYMTTLSDPVNSETFRSVYITTHTRASPYFIGMMWGYIYYKIKTNNIKLPQKTVLGLWVVLLTTALASMFGAWIFYLPGRPYNPLESAFYGGLHRAGWGISLGWLVVASDIGQAGPLTRLFKWNAVVPLSRLTYCAFLIHGGVQLVSIATLRTPEYMTFYKLFWMTSADIFFTFMLATVVSLVFESPICSLQKIFLKGGRKQVSCTANGTNSVPHENRITITIPQ